ncbi:DUF4097 family beta strand repeat-containing protein [Luteimonas terricola]|uniref:DUF4097 domain-containing protein n=1 Tax=Luteimonas terricola TaxID=645597 RepID=A0ABQ2EEJ7_9GAMM|nr:DUF4097 family beta strand repeat-containing protein [Luteimonas terricola]GGK08126.1 hypothetical protein GCM10011394_16790 [Luteimonas terricola]
MNRYLIGFALAGLAFPALAATPINETRPLDARGEVEVSNLKGSIEVRTWDRNEVRITGSLGEGVERLEIGDGGAKLLVRTRYPRNSRNSEPTTLILEIPRQASLDVDSVAASVDVQGVAGDELEIDSVSGDVVAVGAPRKASIESVSGDLQLTLNSHDVDIESVSGKVALRGRIAGSIAAETVSGNIDIDTRGERLARLEASTVSGDARVRGGIADGGRFSFESVSGDIRLALPRDASARVEASTFSGDLDAPDANVVRKRYGPGASLEHSYGTGSGSIAIETFSGSVKLVLD